MKKKLRIVIILLAIIIISILLIYLKIQSNIKNSIQTSVETEIINMPSLIIQGNSDIAIPIGEKYEDEGYIAYDATGNDITSQVTVSGKVDTKKEGSYRITYTLEDENGNKIESYRNIVVKKETKKAIPISSSVTKNTKKDKGLPVLMYHFFYDASKGEKGKDNNWTEISDFEDQMKYLSESHYYFPSWEEVEEYIDGKRTLPDKSVVITIDDGDQSFIKYAIPIIEKYQVKATSFVVTSWNGDWLPSIYRTACLNFQSHSHDMHRAGKNGKGRFVNLTYQQAKEDVIKSKNIIGNCTVFCYPFGLYNENSIKVLKDSGFRLAFTTKEGRVHPGTNKYTLPRVRVSKGISLSVFREMVK